LCEIATFLHVWAGEGYGNQRKSLKNMVELIEQLVEKKAMLDELYKFRTINFGNRPGT